MEGVTVRAGCTAPPVTGITALAPCVLATVMLPLMFSDAVGLKETVIVAFVPGANVEGVAIPVVLKSFAFTVICEIVTALFPLFVMVTLFELELPAFTPEKVMLLGFVVSVTVAAVPVPLRDNTFGELGALLCMLTEPAWLPAVVGANTALNVVFAPPAIVAGVANPLTLYPAPFTDNWESVKGTEPVLVTDTV